MAHVKPLLPAMAPVLLTANVCRAIRVLQPAAILPKFAGKQAVLPIQPAPAHLLERPNALLHPLVPIFHKTDWNIANTAMEGHARLYIPRQNPALRAAVK